MKDNKRKLKIEKLISNIIRLLLILSIIVSFLNKNYLNFSTAIVTLILTFLPRLIAKNAKINLPSSFQIIILLFIFAANYLGNLKEYYTKFWWWDKMLHTMSGVILGFIGYLLIYILNKEDKGRVRLSPAFTALFALSFAVFMGTLWEIYEFCGDNLLGLSMQNNSLNDTMWDLIADTVGACVACLYGYAYEKYRIDNIYKRILSKFFHMNPSIGNAEDDMIL